MTEPSQGLYRFSLFWVASIFLLLLAGGLVTSHKAGLAVPDWPLSYGRFFPPMVGNIFWEHGHRMIAGLVGILTLIFAVWVQIREKRNWVKKLAWAAFALVFVQALLGGLTVLTMLPAPVSIAHACVGQTFFCLAIAIAYFLSPRFAASQGEEHAANRRRLRRLLIMTTAFIYLQLILGAAVRHTGHAVIPHLMVAFLVVVHVILAGVRILRFFETDKALVRFGGGLAFLTVIQIFLGMGSFIFTRLMASGDAPSPAQVAFTAAHQTTGALVLGASVLLTLMVWR